ncbi:RagB/SusD family nutrient uptake outer membrane protein [Winogradskyella sp. SM1960]|uniref:RagB/SusD family nutrient uptake outer membrane protein n=1 Tax=Winogradskyella sp. SM1960 TaxID=2865955 RepID=UPI001CD24475|nr:RagB/SusD family nutrient uptake outer membrane protein [Winogradskyella sp. SM1960]
MKINNKLVVFAFSALACLQMQSCDEEFLTTTPSGSIQIQDAIVDEASLEIATLGIYSGMQSATTFGADFFTHQALLSDNGYVSVNNSNRFTDVNDYTHAIVDGGTVAGIWNFLYGTLLDVNNVISFEGTVTDEDAVSGTPDNRFGEAHIARATILFQLVNWYARPAGSGIDPQLGVVLPTSVNIGGSLPRATVSDVYDQIILDLETAISLMSEEPGVTRLGPTAAKLLLSRVYLYLEDYPNARLYAEQVLNNGEGFSLMGQSDVVPYYASESSPETIFQIEFNSTDNPGSNDAFYATWSLAGTYKQNFATREFYDLMASTDVRKGLYLDNIPASYSDAVVGVDVRKFITPDRDMPHFRMSEAKLNQIEALYYINETLARTELNTWVSTNRDSAYNTNASGSGLLSEILKQRRIELAFEGHRYFDLNRNELDVQKDANCLNNCSLPFTDFRRVFPIPRSEMNTNTSGGFENNAQY